jgi:hypothetical protein
MPFCVGLPSACVAPRGADRSPGSLARAYRLFRRWSGVIMTVPTCKAPAHFYRGAVDDFRDGPYKRPKYASRAR